MWAWVVAKLLSLPALSGAPITRVNAIIQTLAAAGHRPTDGHQKQHGPGHHHGLRWQSRLFTQAVSHYSHVSSCASLHITQKTPLLFSLISLHILAYHRDTEWASGSLLLAYTYRWTLKFFLNKKLYL